MLKITNYTRKYTYLHAQRTMYVAHGELPYANITMPYKASWICFLIRILDGLILGTLCNNICGMCNAN